MGTDDLCKVWDLSNNQCIQIIDASFVPGQVSVMGDRKANAHAEAMALSGSGASLGEQRAAAAATAAWRPFCRWAQQRGSRRRRQHSPC